MGFWSFFKTEKVINTEWILDSHDSMIITTNKGRYRGSCTVWHDAETGRRQGTLREMFLAEVWKKAKWKRQEVRVALAKLGVGHHGI